MNAVHRLSFIVWGGTLVIVYKKSRYKTAMRVGVKMKIRKNRWAAMVLIASMIPTTLTVGGCSSTTKHVKQNTAMDASEDATELTATAVVASVDDETQTVSLCNVTTGETQNFTYNGATTVYSKNNVAMLMRQLNCGEIVDVTYQGTENLLKQVQISKDAWEYKSVNAQNMNRTENTVSVTGRLYKYDSNNVQVFCGNESQMLMDLNEQDEVTIKGIGTQVYSFMITEGHGFIRLGGQDAFIGGTIEVDQNIFMNVQENMLITVGEGEHTVVLRNGDLEAVETITVEKDQETFLDLSEYESDQQNAGKVKFVITPSGAALYINGTLRQANQLLTLTYGNYNVAVMAEGYEDYTGILRVQKGSSDYETIYIDLVESKADTETIAPTATKESAVTATPSATDEADDSESTATPSATTASDKKHTITVKTPEGASVYVNGEFRGVAPVSFEKTSGEITITLSKAGYVTKSYTITVDDGEEDVTYSFASLVEE